MKRKKEIWLPIKNYEGFYEISNYGRVKSLDRTVYFRNNKGYRKYKGKFLKQKYHNGYAMINLNKNKKMETLYIHQLVANHFIPKIKNKNIINHKNGIKSDNYFENLEWVTSKENNIHARNKGLHKDNVSVSYTNTLKKEVVAIKNNNLITKKSCSREMAQYLLQAHILEDVSLETISRAIRKSAVTGKAYHNIYFSYTN